MKRFDEGYVLLADMVSDSYYPPFLVEKVRGEILSLIRLLEEGETDREAIQIGRAHV